MPQPTIATTHSGFGGVEVGAAAAGFRSLWRIEIDPAIAAIADGNLEGETTVADILSVDPANLEVPDAIHFSPVCKRASVATHAGESAEDVAHGQWIARFVDHHQPRIITLENVWPYRNFSAFQIVLAALVRNGYFYDFERVNAANFGVPQTRRRLILRAIRGSLLPPLPPPVSWAGWYAAIEDLIPSLPASKLAKWQLARLPAEIQGALLVDSAGYPDKTGARVPVCRHKNEPANYEKRPMRAILISGQNTSNEWGEIYRDANMPAQTVVASSKGIPRVALPGRVFRVTPHALARFQSFPDSYKLPASHALACRGIGNAVPTLLAQRIYEQLIMILQCRPILV